MLATTPISPLSTSAMGRVLPADPSDPAADPAHLYSFLHQLKSLRVSPPPFPTSVCCMPFDLVHFRSLKTLKVQLVYVYMYVQSLRQGKARQLHVCLKTTLLLKKKSCLR